ncbi:MAG: hypothetical protein FD152_2588 [Xanthobacteraceae bacterium]|nr:MAG: hypothetical protein FD152_2588 [Xanthobacteraceae bacterium]
MIGRYVLPLLALIGLAVAIGKVVADNQAVRVFPSTVQPARAPFASFVAGAGMIEAGTENIAIGTPVSGIVTAIYVKLGDHVNVSDPLFRIDDRDLQGQLLVATAKIKESEAILERKKSIFNYSSRLIPGVSISRLERDNHRLDVAIDEAALASARAQLEQTKIEIERRTVRAPLAGDILQIKVRLGEFAQGGVLTTPLMVLGDTAPLHARVNVDENDAWRVRPEASAIAFVRGNPDLNTPLRFDHFEPYVIPKMSLTGRSTERTDTRVLQVIYSFDRAALPLFVGQLVDVFIEAPPIGAQNPGTLAARTMQ